MAAEAAAGGLIDKFASAVGKAAGHIFSPAMLIMMTVMALPAVAVATPAGAATLGDLGLGVFNHYAAMFTAPFTQVDVIVDVANNTLSGEFAANTVDMATAAHQAHGSHHTMPPDTGPDLSADARAILGME